MTMMRKIPPKVVMVGAGPGDPELITVKGLKAIQQARVILYDALASRELLAQAAADCKKVYVGKRKGKKEFPQEEINQLIVFYATRFGNVVRLKGGDPYVFGRGHEELMHLRRRGIEVEVINGVSSALAAPAAAGIPLTKRGVNESFWVITGTLSNGKMSNDIALAAKSTATVIILMGVSHLSKIANLFQNLRGPQEPIAVIQEATMNNQKIVSGTVSDIVPRIHEAGVTSPAVIVVGKVVAESELLNTTYLSAVEALRKNV
jgi:uroporphyrin-III C-methyltransferase